MNIKEYTSKIFAQIKSNWFMPITQHQVYSEDEIKVGVWTDGKPLYRKVFVADVTLLPTQWVVTTVPVDNVEKIINAVGYVSNGTVCCAVSVSCDHNTFEINYCGAQNQQIPINAFMLEYTKTTDTAETTKVPFEPLVEYSTGEKMIGYWINGKPLYRKTVEISSNKSVGTAWGNLMDFSLGNVISIKEKNVRLANNTDTYNGCVCYTYSATQNSVLARSLIQTVTMYAGSTIDIEYTKTTD